MKPYTIIVYSDRKEIKVFVDDIGTISDVKMIEQDGEVYINMTDLSKVFSLEKTDDECLSVYTYRGMK